MTDASSTQLSTGGLFSTLDLMILIWLKNALPFLEMFFGASGRGVGWGPLRKERGRGRGDQCEGEIALPLTIGAHCVLMIGYA
jgi:hypothetical protein